LREARSTHFWREAPLDTADLALALLYWHTWRERLDRPEQSRLPRKAWAYSDLLFPNSKGEALGKQAIHDALARLSVQSEGQVRLTPELIRQAFLKLNA
jgi:site-specific recombinase XerD